MDQGKHALAMLEHLTRDEKFKGAAGRMEEAGQDADQQATWRRASLRGSIAVE